MYYGFDMGGTKTAFAIFSENFKMIEQIRFATPKNDISAMVDIMKAHIQKFDEKYQCAPPLIGLSIAGSIDDKGQVISANIPAINASHLSPILSQKLKRIVRVENDVNCFALSENLGGCAHKHPIVFAITLGTGVGGSLVIDGKIISGKNGFAGEWGHTEVGEVLERHNLPRRPCGCGLKACLDTYGSGHGLSLIYKHLSQKKHLGRDIIALKNQGDILAIKAYNIMIDILSSHLVYIIHMINPHIIPVGGGLSRIEGLCEDLSQSLKSKLISPSHLPLICPSHFSDSGSVRGAALLTRP